jgi:3-oxoacyl-[acyl-carrier-protein] synthase II
MDRFCHLALASSVQAFESAGLDKFDLDSERFGVIIGTGIGGIKSFSDEIANLMEKGPQRVSPFFIPRMIGNMASAQTAILLKAKGYTSDPCSACASGTNAIGEAFRRIQSGYEDVFIAGGSEACIVPIALAGFTVMRALSRRNDEPEKASRPFDLARDGFVIAEGAGVLVLEEWEHAHQRSAPVFAEMVGYGASCDAYHITLPEPSADGPARCMLNALKDAGIQPEELDYINAHGTSTKANDATETAAIKKVFASHAPRISIHSSKSMLGHLLGAAGGVEAAIMANTIHTGKIHPTINLDSPDPECDLDYTPQTMKERSIRYGLSNSFGFGGHNYSLIMKRVP